MNRILIASIAAVSALSLAGCSSSPSDTTNQVAMTLSGTANSTSLEEVVVEDVEGTEVATDTTDADGSYTVELPDVEDLKFPLVVRVRCDSGEIHALVPRPDSLERRHHRADLNEISERAFRHFKEIPDSLIQLKEEEWKARLDSSAREWVEEMDPCMAWIVDTSAEAQVRDSILTTLEGEELFEAMKDRMEKTREICKGGMPEVMPPEFYMPPEDDDMIRPNVPPMDSIAPIKPLPETTETETDSTEEVIAE